MPERQEADDRIVPLIVERWSPRSFDASDIPQTDLDVIFEAAGWAPSAYNIQPWMFLYARRGDAHWDDFFSGLVEFNQKWADDASVLLYIVSDTKQRKDDGSTSDNHSHSFDCGAAWAMMALQARHMGYYTHGMTGLHFDKATEMLGIPEDHRLEAAVAIGRKAPKENLPEQFHEKEQPNGRDPVGDFAINGKFPAS